MTHDPDLDGWSWEDAEPEDAPRDARWAYWTPPALDAHTHLGDAFLRPARENLPRSIAALVAPPHGLKHRELARADPQQVVKAIGKRSHTMKRAGTVAAIDFREGGVSGLRSLHRGVEGSGLDVHALARPAADPGDVSTWADEAQGLLDGPTLGLGLSGIRDLPRDALEQGAGLCRSRGKVLGLHLSEARHESVEEALALEPRLLVHLVHTTGEEWDDLADAGVVAATCATSNRFFGLRPPVEAFHRAFREQGLMTAFGTDNAMLSDGDLRDEARLVGELSPQADLDWVLRSLCWNPWRALDLGPDPGHPGLLWGVDGTAPTTHPDDTPLSRCGALWAHAPYRAPLFGRSG